MGIVESTLAFLFRKSAPDEAQQRQRTAAILMPIVDSAMDVAECIIDNEPNEPKKANDQQHKTARPE